MNFEGIRESSFYYNMEDQCFYCEKEASNVCYCKIPMILVCEEHLGTHLSSTYFSHNVQSFPFKALPDSKNLILNKINELINSNKEQQNILYRYSEENIQKLNELLIQINAKICESVNVYIENLKNHEADLVRLKCKIESLTIIKPKEYMTPLEKGLLNHEYMKSLISSLSDGEVEFKDPDVSDFLKLIPSNVFPMLSGYNFIVNLQEGGFQVYNKDKVLKNFEPDSCINSSFLKVSQESLIISGGTNSERLALEFNIDKGNYIDLPIMNFERISHSMAWIDGYPAVLGGKTSENENLSSVEILKGNVWEVTNKSMNHKRANFTAINYVDQVFVVGGNECLLEVYRNERWHCIDLVLNGNFWPTRLPALYGYGHLMIFGTKLNLIKLDFNSLTGQVPEENQDGNLSTDLKIKRNKLQFIQNSKIASIVITLT